MADKDFIVAIELGSSRISGIAGKKKDGVMQVVAYAEENPVQCVQRGVILNIEKTYQSINSVIAKLEATINVPIARAYVGVAGQSVRSYRSIIKRNMVTHSYITAECVEGIRKESYDIPFSDCQVLQNYPQDYIVDSNLVPEPVGIMGTNIEGDFINIIANKKLLSNITTTFDASKVKIADVLLAPYELCEQVLTDIEKRSGCALVDLGADTTTVVVYKNKVIRFLVTLPIGMNCINKDLSAISLLDEEAEEVKKMYADAFPSSTETDSEPFVTNVGTQVNVDVIRTVIDARLTEIIANVNNQLERSGYADKLLAGLVLVGGGSQIKNIEVAFQNATKVEKVRIASNVDVLYQKASGMGNPAVFETPVGLSVLSLLLAGKENCAGDSKEEEATQVKPDLYDQMQQETEREKLRMEQEARDRADMQCAIEFDGIKNKIRAQYDTVVKALEELRKHGSDKKVREAAENVCGSALNVITEEFQQHVDTLSSKEKYKQSAVEGSHLAQKLREANAQLCDAVAKAKEDNKFFSRFGRWISDIVSEN